MHHLRQPRVPVGGPYDSSSADAATTRNLDGMASRSVSLGTFSDVVWIGYYHEFVDKLHIDLQDPLISYITQYI